MLSFKDSLPQALQESSIVAYFNSLMKGSIHGFYDRSSNLSQLKSDSYDSILVVVNRLIKMVHYELVKVTINIFSLLEVIVNMIVHHHRVPESIIINRGWLFTSKFWFLLRYFLEINKKLSTAFYPQIDDQNKRQSSKIEAYLIAFVNWE